MVLDFIKLFENKKQFPKLLLITEIGPVKLLTSNVTHIYLYIYIGRKDLSLKVCNTFNQAIKPNCRFFTLQNQLQNLKEIFVLNKKTKSLSPPPQRGSKLFQIQLKKLLKFLEKKKQKQKPTHTRTMQLSFQLSGFTTHGGVLKTYEERSRNESLFNNEKRISLIFFNKSSDVFVYLQNT